MSKSHAKSKPLDLEQQRKRAKDLLKAQRRGDPDATARIQQHLPRAAMLLPAEARALALKLADAQLVVAREAGFASWPQMKREIGRLAEDALAPSAIELAVRAGDHDEVQALLASGVTKDWQRREALEIAVDRDDREAARMLLACGCWADFAGRRWGRHGGCLHAAILQGRPVGLLEVLIAGGARVTARDRDRKTPLALAIRTASDEAADLLRRHGATDEEVGEVDRALGAVVRGAPVVPLARRRFLRSDHQHVSWALRAGRAERVPALLGLGLDPNVPDDDGATPLHLAVVARSPAALDALLGAGARVDALDYRGETALQVALREPDDALRAELTSRLAAAGAAREARADLSERFEEAADAVVEGDLARLTVLLDREPELVHARSVRGHASTLLHYVAANGVETWRQRSPRNAGAIAELLLERGADPDALAFTYGGGPAQTVLGLTVTSSHPHLAGVTGDITRALIRHGAAVAGGNAREPAVKAARRALLPARWAAGRDVDLEAAASIGLRDAVFALVARDGTLAPGAKAKADAAVPDQEILDRAFIGACGAGDPEIVEYLLQAGARLGARDHMGGSCLHEAVLEADLATLRLLIARGAPLEAENDHGGTPLGFLVWVVRHRWREGRNFAGAAEILIAAGANLDAVDGGLPTGHEDVDAVFRRHGKG